MVVDIRLANNLHGLGSATPVKYVTGEDTDSVLAAVAASAEELVGIDIANYQQIFSDLRDMRPNDHSARAAIEIAALDAVCKMRNISMCDFFGGSSSLVETDITIPIVPPDTARMLASEAVSRGFNSLKVKVGCQDPDDDFARVVALSQGAPGCSIRLDANQGFSPVAAVEFVSKLLDTGVPVDMLEQPVDRADADGLLYVTRHTPVPVFADESVVTSADALRLIEMDAVDGINIKLMKCGVSSALEIIEMCRARQKELMIGCMIETGISLSAAIHLACGTGAFGRLDLDGHLLVSEHPFVGGFDYDGPRIAVDRRCTGHGACASSQP